MTRKKTPLRISFVRTDPVSGVWDDVPFPTMRLARTKVTVHPHIHEPGVWFVSIGHEDRIALKAKDELAAKVEGLEVARKFFAEILASFPEKG